MRDVSRIDGFMDSLRELWKAYAPDMRFGQLMIGFDAWHERHYRRDVFYLEEDELLMRLKEFLGPDKANSQQKRA